MFGKITGRVECLANGKLLLSKSGAVANGIGKSGEPPFESSPVMGTEGIHGFVESPIEASLEVTITDRDDVLLDDLARIEEGTVIFRRAGGSGKVYTLADAVCTGNFKITGGEGETPIKFIGSYWIENTQ